jgi:16S rRNA processing protein RimM
MAAPGAEERLEVGRIDKAHGLAGEVVVTLSTNRGERLDPGAILYAGDRRLTVKSVRPNNHRFLVQFSGVSSREAADGFHGAVLSADPIDDPDELWVHELVGSSVIDTTGNEIGMVSSVLDNPASDLLVLESGALIPAHFVVGFDGDVVTVDPPEGLFDI